MNHSPVLCNLLWAKSRLETGIGRYGCPVCAREQWFLFSGVPPRVECNGQNLRRINPHRIHIIEDNSHV